MSNEPNPASASLRLKPRLRPAQEAGGATPAGDSSGDLTAVQTATPAASETTVAVAEAPVTTGVRLRPKLQPTAPVPEPVAQPAPDAPPHGFSAPPPVTPAPAIPAQPLAAGATPSDSAPVAPVVGDPGKFKFKPKVPGSPGSGSVPVPPLFLPADAPPGLAPLPSTPEPGATSRSGRATSPMPIPHVKVEGAELAPEVDIVVRPPQAGRGKRAFVVIALLAAAGFGAYSAWPHLPAEFSVAGYTVRTKPGFTISKAKVATPVSLPSPSETLNKLAHVPGNAINKAQDALAARRASGQDRVDAAAAGEDLPGKNFGVPPAAPIKPAAPPPKAPAPTTSVTTVAPGMSAPVSVEAAPEAAPEFRAFVTNARISGIFQGNPARAVINGKLSRAGEIVDSGLGITFEGLDAGRKNLVFKDRSGATVSRRF